ncbi:MAG: hypothetical protein SFX73_40085 [Kofleriaceae bacterium]|nr:hypothetical protein [Kofleriaceae bacterium]
MRLVLVPFVLVAGCSNAADPSDTPDAPIVQQDARPDAGPPLETLLINEVVASGAPDWVEVVNASQAAIELSEYCFVDAADDFVKCKPFPAMTLAPGARFAQDVDEGTAGFKLGSDEELWVYRIADQRVSDSVDWAEGDSPANESFARIPDTTGDFARTNQVTKGAANLADNPNAPLAILKINEVAAGETPDWFEIFNATGSAVQLSEYCYLDTSAMALCKPFPAMSLAAGAYYAQDVDDAISGFKLASDEAVFVYRISDNRISDSVDWDTGASPATMSYRRIPDKTGTFATGGQTKGTANQ